MWSAVGPAPGVFLFDEHESGPREEGEVADMSTTVRGATSQEHGEHDDGNEEGNRDEPSGTWDGFDFRSKHQTDSFRSGFISTPRKRSWPGLMTSEERIRPSRRPRREEEVTEGTDVCLPSISELVGNPWGTQRGERDGRISHHPPVHASTPRLGCHSRRLNPDYQSDADVSGKAPTPHDVSTVASPMTSLAEGAIDEERAGKHGSRTERLAASRLSAETNDMDMDDVNGDSPRSSPDLRQARQERNRRELQELEERRRELQETIREADEEYRLAPRRGTDRDNRKNRHAPERMHLNHGGRLGSATGRSTVDSPRGRLHDTAEESNLAYKGENWSGAMPDSRWSAIPNTKAWEYNELQRAKEQGWFRNVRGCSSEDGAGRSRRGADDSSSQPEEMEEREGNGHQASHRPSVTRAEDNAPIEREDQMVYDQADWADNTFGGTRTGPGVGGAVPSIVAREEGVADLPTVVQNPHDERWTVHFEDPETLLRGQSADFVKVVWWGADPTVVFSVYNYKYTENDVINRHIESAVTSMVTILTGETNFYVVPPDPEWRCKLQSRNLPFVWAIRGLSEAGAWEMVKIRVATSKGVTIMTYPCSLSNPRWVCSLAGFLRPDTEAIKSAVLGVLRSDYMLGRLADLTRSNENLRQIPEKRRVEHVIRSLEIKMSTTSEGAYIANVYILPPSDDMDAWRDWADEMRAQRYNSFLCGAGLAKRVYWCAGCRGVNHEEHECSIPKMRGWKGPDAGAGTHTKMQVIGLSRGGAGRGRGNSARGQERNTGQYGARLNAGTEQGDRRGMNGYGRGTGMKGGQGRGAWSYPTRGSRGTRRAGWSPAIRQ